LPLAEPAAARLAGAVVKKPVCRAPNALVVRKAAPAEALRAGSDRAAR
jgi:hypothetical protein